VELGKNVIQEYNAVSGFLTESRYTQKFNEDAGIFMLSETSEILLVGGKSPENQQTSRTCIAVQPGTTRIRALPNLPNPQQGVRVVEVDKKLYAMAGFSGTESFSQVLVQQQWTPIAALPLPVKYPACFAIQQSIYLIGGEKLKDRDSICGDVFTLNCQTGAWAKLSVVYPLAICHASALFMKEHGLLVFGGDNDKGEPCTQSYIFNGQQFTQAAAIESQLELIFDDPPCFVDEDVFLYSRAGDLFKFNSQNGTWVDGVEEEEASLVTPPRL
jgi:N-acetylneuraminic acid mutarotase